MSSAHGRSSLAPSSISDVHSYSGSSSSSYHRRADSGYGSGSSPAGPLYDAYMRWKEADDARRRLPDEEHDVEECKKLLQEKRGAEQNQSSPRPGQAKRKPSVLHLIPFKSSKHSSHPEDAIHVSPEHNTTPVTVLELQLKELTERADATRQLAESLDARFDALKSCLEDGHIPLCTQGRLSQAEKAVSSREAAYNGSVDITISLRRARHAAQSAHLHYRQAMDIVDSVCSPKRGAWGSMFGDEQSREQTYKDAASAAHKSQVCFNECLRALEAHLDLLQEEEVQACRDLQELGLLQAVRLYELMYGGKALAMGITQQSQIMLQKQDAVFARLTTFAVGVQNCTVHCESVERGAKDKRDSARRYLVSLWMSDGSSPTLSSNASAISDVPSMYSV